MKNNSNQLRNEKIKKFVQNLNEINKFIGEDSIHSFSIKSLIDSLTQNGSVKSEYFAPIPIITETNILNDYEQYEEEIRLKRLDDFVEFIGRPLIIEEFPPYENPNED